MKETSRAASNRAQLPTCVSTSCIASLLPAIAERHQTLHCHAVLPTLSTEAVQRGYAPRLTPTPRLTRRTIKPLVPRTVIQGTWAHRVWVRARARARANLYGQSFHMSEAPTVALTVTSTDLNGNLNGKSNGPQRQPQRCCMARTHHYGGRGGSRESVRQISDHRK